MRRADEDDDPTSLPRRDDGIDDEFNDGGGDDDDDANPLLASSITEDPDARFFGARGTAPARNHRILSRFGGGDGASALYHRSSCRSSSWCRFSGRTNAWIFGILLTAGVAALWVGSFGSGARTALLQLRDGTTATPSSNNSSNFGGGGNPDDDELVTSPRPFLHELIADFHKKVTGNVSFLLDFAILGHPKCSTSSLLLWLRQHPEILMHDYEVHSLTSARPAEMVSLLYALPNRPHKKRGYKAPADITHPHVLRMLRTYWPKLKIIVGIRHPVRWFESYYNFKRLQADRGMPSALKLHLGPAEEVGVPDLAHFHTHLSLLGKTNVTNPHEAALLGPEASRIQPAHMTNKVFLYESTQPYDLHDGRNDVYRCDLQSFLELKEPLEAIPLHGETHGETYNYTTETFHYNIDICEAKYAELRRQLVEVGATAAKWILAYFVPHPDVTVPSPERFEELLMSWSLDPCEGKQQ